MASEHEARTGVRASEHEAKTGVVASEHEATTGVMASDNEATTGVMASEHEARTGVMPSEHEARGGGNEKILIPGGIFFSGVTPPRGVGYEKKWVLQKNIFFPCRMYHT